MSGAIVIGAGHNGLVAGLSLARAGRAVTIVEKRGVVGGLCAATEIHPGYRVPGLLHDTTGVRRPVVAALGLSRYGLQFEDEAPSVLAAHSQHKGVVLHANAARSRDELEALHKGDGDGYAAWRAFLSRVRGFVARVLNERPPQMKPSSLAELWKLGVTGLALRRLGNADMLELLRVAPMCAADWLHEYFNDPLPSAALAAPAVTGAFLGPWAAGSAASVLLYECVRGAEVKGGPAALIESLREAFEAAGGTIRLEAEVARILVARGAVSGVQLADGSTLEAPLVLATCDPKRALLELLEPGALPLRVEEQIGVVRMRGTTAKVNLALDGQLAFRGREGERHARAVVADDVDDIERAFDAVKYRGCSKKPHLDVSVPSVRDASLAPSGKDVVSILAHFVPHDLEGGWSDAAREGFGDAVVEVLESVAPGTKGLIRAREVLGPADIEARYGLSGGHIHHGEHALDQLLFMRPTPALARYATPIAGLYLGGSGSHPSGGVTCQPGALAAQAILEG
ncbi:MAG: NAD(P)/FAD-dependent oxidoreductase [Myxococcales bacterium]|nr:NAD(P)/FAD-dependent oxidoreductase [Myxococcales bacterium]MDH5306403.1 NAD(P)/FAD-dependent oxidoreductase [Myxococcales bacterium]MDH5565477.1 NAD(P)/FAD-dependent oxidoreductase [Myxococcales bacterium]